MDKVNEDVKLHGVGGAQGTGDKAEMICGGHP